MSCAPRAGCSEPVAFPVLFASMSLSPCCDIFADQLAGTLSLNNDNRGGGIVYHQHDEKELNWELGGVRSGASVRPRLPGRSTRVRLADPLLRLLQRFAEAHVEAVPVERSLPGLVAPYQAGFPHHFVQGLQNPESVGRLDRESRLSSPVRARMRASVVRFVRLPGLARRRSVSAPGRASPGCRPAAPARLGRSPRCGSSWSPPYRRPTAIFPGSP